MEFQPLTCFFSLLLVLIFPCGLAAESTSPFCPKRSLPDIVALQEDLCYVYKYEGDCTSRVLQIDGRDIDKTLSLYQNGSHEYTAVLFYAEWCPFSRIMRQKFDSFSISFPAVHHIAVESSALWPSELSQHGVRSLPALFVHNKTHKVQYYGSRSLRSIGQFYMERTGFFPIYSYSKIDSLLKSQQSREMSRRSWFQLWLHDDLYLAFAVVFLTLRLLFHLQLKIVARLREYWSLKEMSWKAQKGLLRQVNADRSKNTSNLARKNKGKYLRKEERILSVPSWPSSSLAAVTLAECSSRVVAREDAHEKVHLWG
eukprot:c22235_g1_i1 orf=598-1536(+)